MLRVLQVGIIKGDSKAAVAERQMVAEAEVGFALRLLLSFLSCIC